MNRFVLIKVHLVLTAFLLPVALMFFVTGGLYTWGFSGSYHSENYDVVLSVPLTADQAELTALVQTELQRLSVAVPSGGAKVKRAGTSFYFEWTGAKRDVVLEPTADPLLARLTVKETSWYRNLVQLHKAKGGQLFKVYAAVLASALLLILLSGFLIAWQVPTLRRLASGCAGAGLVMFVAIVWWS